MFIGKMRLAAKLAVGFGLVLLLLAAVAYTGISRITTLKSDAVDVAHVRIPELEMVYSIIKNFDLSARAVRNLALTTTDSMNQREKNKYEQGKTGVNEALDRLGKTLVTARGRELFNAVKEHYLATVTLMDKAIPLGMANKNDELADIIINQVIGVQDKFLISAETLAQHVVEMSHVAGNQAVNTAVQGQVLESVLGGIGLLLGCLIAFLITRSITKPILRVVSGLTEAAGQVASASGQVSSASQQLAEGSSEQAASIEETSSSLEEMSSMTKQNADHANEANQLMKEVSHIMDAANQSMTRLSSSMAEISRASEETQKIIKTIDEIAFQTNLLALNAAVEAARAGEAGAGFAVVADEVRNLALRAAEAAKNTAALIEGTVKTVKGGAELAAATGSEFQEVTVKSSRMAELVGEITAASQEQATGIEQINKAVNQMDKVVQTNAANAEESASASEEMTAQAAQLESYVEDLADVVGGGAGRGNQRQSFERFDPRSRSLVVADQVKSGPKKQKNVAGKSKESDWVS